MDPEGDLDSSGGESKNGPPRQDPYANALRKLAAGCAGAIQP